MTTEGNNIPNSGGECALPLRDGSCIDETPEMTRKVKAPESAVAKKKLSFSF
jgi:hypothetical protein